MFARKSLLAASALAAYPGGLTIGTPSGILGGSSGAVVWDDGDQITQSANVVINNGVMDLNGHNDTIGALTMHGSSSVTTGAGAGKLTLNGDVVADTAASIIGNLDLGTATRTFKITIEP